MPDRRRRNRLRRRLAVFGPTAIVVLTGVVSLGALRRALASRDWVLHTRDVLDASGTVLTAMLDAESGQRGYLLTHDTSYVAANPDADARARAGVARLRELTSDNPLQQRRTDTLRVLVERRLAVLDSMVGAERAGRTNLAAGIATHATRRTVMANIRRLVAAINAEEARLLVIRREDERRAIALIEAVLLIGTVIAATLAFLVNRGFDRALRDRREALSSAETANLKLQEQAVELEQQAEAAEVAMLESEQASEHATSAKRAAEESERRAERLQAATEAFTGALSLREVSDMIIQQAVAALGAQSGALADVEGDHLRFVALHGIPANRVGEAIPLTASLPICVAVVERRPVLSSSLEEMRARYPAVEPYHRRDGVQAFAAFPLLIEDRVVGVVLVRFAAPHTLSAADQAFMGALCRIATEAFERARLFEAERQARTAAETANRAKATFLASMSHELRTPLQAALGFAQLVRSGVYGPINETQGEVLGRVERSQTHLARLIDDILDFARLDAGRVRLTVADVPLGETIADIAPLVEPQAAAKKLELSLLPPPESLRVRADRQRLQQILVNIVGNAIKFTPEGGMIRVGAVADDGRAVIQIRDSGIGIPPDRLQAIFEPFVQVDDGLTRTSSGTGLGLAISRDLARAMGGDLSVASELGKGSTFTIELPIAGASDDDAGRA